MTQFQAKRTRPNKNQHKSFFTTLDFFKDLHALLISSVGDMEIHVWLLIPNFY